MLNKKFSFNDLETSLVTADDEGAYSGTTPINANTLEGSTKAQIISSAVSQAQGGDYVVEQGASGIWTYRKWANGDYECWCNTPSINFSNFSAFGSSGLYAKSVDANISLPITFTTTPFIFINNKSIEWLSILFTSITTTKIGSIVILRDNNSSINVQFNCYLKGKWK